MKTPSNIYLLSLPSSRSKVAMSSFLNKWAITLQGVKSHESLDWSSIKYTDILKGLESIKVGKAPTTLNNYLAAIKGAAKQAWMQEYLSTRQYQSIKDIKRIQGERVSKGRALTKVEMKQLVDYCSKQGTVLGHRDAALIAISYGAGLRRSETASLTLEDYNSSEGLIRIQGKGNKQKVNPLGNSTTKLVNDWLKVRGSKRGNLFTRGKKGNKLQDVGITDQTVYDTIIGRCKDAGLGKITAHDLRKTFITHLLDNNEDLFTVCSLARHSSVDTTRSYDLRDNSVKEKAGRSLSF